MKKAPLELKKSPNFSWWYNTSKWTTFIFDPTSKSLWILNYKIQEKKPIWILKGFKLFGKNSINSPKFFLDMIYNTVKLDWLPGIENFEVPLEG
jgi:hypothetical protein